MISNIEIDISVAIEFLGEAFDNAFNLILTKKNNDQQIIRLPQEMAYQIAEFIILKSHEGD